MADQADALFLGDGEGHRIEWQIVRFHPMNAAFGNFDHMKPYSPWGQ